LLGTNKIIQMSVFEIKKINTILMHEDLISAVYHTQVVCIYKYISVHI